MKPIQALLFPDTRPVDADVALLRTICDTLLHYALPSESTLQGPAEGYFPLSMSEDEQARFRHLLRDIKGHEGEFHASRLAAMVTGRADHQEMAAWSLVASIRSGATPAKTEIDEQETVWQALLLLRLAEMLREEEEEIASELAAVSELEDALLAELKGEDELDEEDASELGVLAAGVMMSGSALNPDRLCKAWGRLYLRDSRAGDAMVLATSQEEAAALLADLCETRTGQPPLSLCTLELQTATADGLAQLREALAEPRQTLSLLLQEAAASERIPTDLLARFRNTGEAMQQAAIPCREDSPSTRHLTLYALEGVSFQHLFALLCEPGREPTPMPPATTTLMAVVGKAVAQR